MTLKIDPVWLAEKLRERWHEIELDVIEPRPQAYLLNWLYRGSSQPLLGALHRDQYALVLTGDNLDVYEFAAWYRSIVDAEQPLYLYEWADTDVELRPGMKAEDL